jgi:uncharacterized membrane protein
MGRGRHEPKEYGQKNMDSTIRTLSKAITWQSLGVITMTALSYPHTNSFSSALSLALSAAVSGFVVFLLHERVWNAVRWGQKPTDRLTKPN